MSNYIVGNISAIGTCWCACHQPWFSIVRATCYCRCNAKFTSGFMQPRDEPVLKSEWQLMQERVNQLEAENKNLKAENKEISDKYRHAVINNGTFIEANKDLHQEIVHLKEQLQLHKETGTAYRESQETVKTEFSNLLDCDKDWASIYNTVKLKIRAQSRDKTSQDERCEVSGAKLDDKPVTANLFVNGQPVGKLINCHITVKE